MFISLSIKNSPLNKTVYIEFDKGINVLQGKNSSGKSTVIEMLNYILFGSTALRSAISTYHKDFEVESKLLINNIEYVVNRTVKDSQIYMFDKDTKKFLILATGITPVNEYLKSLLTYDYKIFSLTNFCKQHDLLKLTSCSPTELVNLIEVVSGLDSSYKLLVSLKESRKECKAVVKSLTNTLANASELNVDFEPNEEFDGLLKENEEVLNNFQRVQQKQYESIEKFNTLNQSLLKIIKQQKELELSESNVRCSLDPSYTLEQLKSELTEFESVVSMLETYKRLLNGFSIPSTTYPEQILLKQEQLISDEKSYKEYLKVKERLANHLVICPNCDHEFHNTDEELLDTFTEPPEKPFLSQQQINIMRTWNEREDSYNETNTIYNELLEKKNHLTDKKFLIDQIDYHNILDKNTNLRDHLNSEYDSLLTQLEEYGVDKNVHDIEIEISNKYDKSYKDYQTTLEWFNTFKLYVATKHQYLQQQEVLLSFKDELNTNTENLAKYNLLYDVLMQVKKTVQTESFPIINSVASDILSQITGGERNKVFINESFKIEVDDNAVDTIEGSGKVIANLALRIALLNTFYKDTFLVCLFDEIDESLHEDRFEYMEESFNKLADQGYQLILTSHKQYSVDKIINMDTFKK